MSPNYEFRQFWEYMDNLLAATPVGSATARIIWRWMEDREEFATVLSAEEQKDLFGEPVGRRDRVARPSWEKIRKVVANQREFHSTAKPDLLNRNLDEFAKAFGFNRQERAILDVARRQAMPGWLSELIESLGTRDRTSPFEIIARLTGLNANTVSRLLSPTSRMIEAGVVATEQNLSSHGIVPVFAMPQSLAKALNPPNRGFAEVRRAFVGNVLQSPLKWEDFDHIAEERDFIEQILKAALCKKEKGINILIYGPPGTGKTEFCKVMAARIKAELFSIGERDESGAEPTRGERLGYFRLAQSFLGNQRRKIVLFDEMEDLLSSDSLSIRFAGRQITNKMPGSKVFINRTLEENRVPVFWTTNDSEPFDGSILRRMTVAVEIKIPSVTVRQRIWRRTLDAARINVSDADVSSLSRDFEVSPAIAAGAIKAARLTGGGTRDIRQAVRGLVKVMSGKDSPKPSRLDAAYDPSLICADVDLAHLADRLAASESARNFSLCLYGPPGTGKSAYVRHLAERLGMELIQKRASNLLSMFVGGSEKNIARAFAGARENKAFLVIDEADSLLRDRTGARHSWEVTQVNEMLTWMESHDFPFACTTNLMDVLDQASLRRFTFKVKFDYLGPVEAAVAFRRFFGMEAPASLSALSTLTPGDFAVVARKARFLGAETDPDKLVAMLEKECAAKPNAPRPIGFQPGLVSTMRQRAAG